MAAGDQAFLHTKTGGICGLSEYRDLPARLLCSANPCDLADEAASSFATRYDVRGQSAQSRYLGFDGLCCDTADPCSEVGNCSGEPYAHEHFSCGIIVL